MNEVEKKEIEEIKQVFANNGFEDSNGGEEIDILVHDIINAGYGKIEDYKKEIERLKELITKIKEIIDKNFYYDNLTTSGELSDLLKEYGIGEE